MNGKHAKKTNYRSMNHVSSTSNTVERLFSRAKLVMIPQRRCMATLEAILMLRCNRDLWDIYFIDRIVLKNDVTDHPTEDDPKNDGEEEKFEAEEDGGDFEDDIEYAQRLSADQLPFNHGGNIHWQGEKR